MNKQDIQTVLDAIDEARTYTSSEAWSPSMTEELTKAIAILTAALAEPSEPEPLRDDEVGDIARGMNIEITLNNEDTLLDFARAIESAVWERGFEMSIEYAQGWDDAKAQVTTDNSATLQNALAEIERLKAEVARLEPLQYRQAPCHKFCESQAYKIEIRGLTSQIELKDAALRVALEALMHYQYGGSSYKEQADKAITTIKEALS